MRVVDPRHGREQRANDGVGLRGFELREGFVELFPGARIQHIETVSIQALAVGGRSADQEIEELRSAALDRTGIAAHRRHEYLAEFAQGGPLRGGEQTLRDRADQVRRGLLKLGNVSRAEAAATTASATGRLSHWCLGLLRRRGLLLGH